MPPPVATKPAAAPAAPAAETAETGAHEETAAPKAAQKYKAGRPVTIGTSHFAAGELLPDQFQLPNAEGKPELQPLTKLSNFGACLADKTIVRAGDPIAAERDPVKEAMTTGR